MSKVNLNKYGSCHPIELQICKYQDNDNLAIEMITWEDGYPEPWNSLTVNLDKRANDCAFVDTNNNGFEIIDWIYQNKLGVLTGEIGHSGFCSYPEVKFNLDVVKNCK